MNPAHRCNLRVLRFVSFRFVSDFREREREECISIVEADLASSLPVYSPSRKSLFRNSSLQSKFPHRKKKKSLPLFLILPPFDSINPTLPPPQPQTFCFFSPFNFSSIFSLPHHPVISPEKGYLGFLFLLFFFFCHVPTKLLDHNEKTRVTGISLVVSGSV